MRYNIEVLKKMIKTLDFNIEMFQGYFKIYEGYQNEEIKKQKIASNEKRIADMVLERRGLAAIIENDGEPVEGAYVDSMMYSAQAGADTSWWTKGT